MAVQLYLVICFGTLSRIKTLKPLLPFPPLLVFSQITKTTTAIKVIENNELLAEKGYGKFLKRKQVSGVI